MNTDIREALAIIEKRLDTLEEKIDAIAEEVNEMKADLPPDLDEDLSEIKSLLIQLS